MTAVTFMYYSVQYDTQWSRDNITARCLLLCFSLANILLFNPMFECLNHLNCF